MKQNPSGATTMQRFSALWTRCCRPLTINADPAPVYTDLIEHYREPHRHYHTCAHIDNCLREFDRITGRLPKPDALETAIWFHDAIYIPGVPDNEQQSAELLCRWGQDQLPSDFIKHVCKLILCTTHLQPPKTAEEAFLVDIDLSSFGLEWPAFIADSHNVRAEQKHRPDEHYYLAHARFLNMLLNRDRIFFSDFFYQLYETPARGNIERLLMQPQYAHAA